VSHPDLLDISNTDPEGGADSGSPASVGKLAIGDGATVMRSATAPNSPELTRAGAPHQPPVMRAALGARRQGASTLHAPEAHRGRSHSFRMHTLFYDAQVNNLEECVELLAKGENVNQAKGVAQLRPLHVAATCGSFEVASQLLNAGAEKDVQYVYTVWCM
jgi:ankyrin repeat protein